jgi:hypothetical protein
MEKFKGTPGPWRVGKRGGCVVCDSDKGLTISGAIGEQAIEYYGGNLIGESISIDNAKLIAAAPELLESLQWLVSQIKNLEGEISLFGMDKCFHAIKIATE